MLGARMSYHKSSIVTFDVSPQPPQICRRVSTYAYAALAVEPSQLYAQTVGIGNPGINVSALYP